MRIRALAPVLALFLAPILAVLMAVASARGQVVPAAHASSRFEWNPRAAHELDSRHTIETSLSLAPEDKQALMDAIVAQLRRHCGPGGDREDLCGGEIPQLAAKTRIERVDLNHDGRLEVIGQSFGLGPCGAVGNCMGWIFQLTDHHVKLLLDSAESVGGFQVIEVRAASTGGFRDIVLGTHESVSDRNLYLYQYIGGAYRLSACYSGSVPFGTPLHSSPRISPVRCPQPTPRPETTDTRAAD